MFAHHQILLSNNKSNCSCLKGYSYNYHDDINYVNIKPFSISEHLALFHWQDVAEGMSKNLQHKEHLPQERSLVDGIMVMILSKKISFYKHQSDGIGL
jgi:hypothetical protein